MIKLKSMLNITEQAPQPMPAIGGAPQPMQAPAPLATADQPSIPEEPTTPEPDTDTTPSPEDPGEYDWTKDFRAFEDAKNKAESQAKKKLIDKMNKQLVGKKVTTNASRGYGQPKTDHTIEQVKKLSVEFWYKEWVVILQDENDKKYFLTPGVNIKIEQGGESGCTEDQAPGEPDAAATGATGEEQPNAEVPTSTGTTGAPDPMMGAGTGTAMGAQPEAMPTQGPGDPNVAMAQPGMTGTTPPPVPGQQPPQPVPPEQLPPPKKKKLAEAPKENYKTCPRCKGSGSQTDKGWPMCNHCQGTGKVVDKDNVPYSNQTETINKDLRFLLEFMSDDVRDSKGNVDFTPYIKGVKTAINEGRNASVYRAKIEIPIKHMKPSIDARDVKLAAQEALWSSGNVDSRFSRGSINVSQVGRMYIMEFVKQNAWKS